MQKYSRQNTISRKNNHFFNVATYNNGLVKRGNKNYKLIMVLICVGVLLCAFSTNKRVYAVEKPTENVESDLMEEIENRLDELDTTDLDKFIEKVESEVGNLFSGSSKELMMKIMKGEFITDFDGFMNYLLYLTKRIFGKYIPIIFFIVFIAILSGVLQGLTSGFIKKPTNDVISFVCYSAIVIVLFTALSGLIVDVKKSVLNVKQLMDISFPIILTLMTAMGGIQSVTIYKPMMLVLSGVIVNIITSIVLPLFIAGVVLSVVGNISGAVKLTKLPKFFSSVSSWVLGTAFSLFSGFVVMKGITGVTLDNISINVTKFALSSYVPILGGYVSDGFDIVVASCSLLKNSFGVTITVILVLCSMLPILKTVFFTLMLKLVEAVIEPISSERITNMIGSVSKSMTSIISALVGLTFTFFILITLIVYTVRFMV